MQGKLTSIIILTYNQLEYTKFCIESIREKTEKDTYEIIVVDNGSTDDTVWWLEGQTDVICIKNKENKGFPAGCNQGIAVAKGTEILLLNNDTIVTDRWLDNLKTALYSDGKIGAVGPVTNSCSAYQSIEVPYTNIQDMQSFATQYNQTDPQKWEKRIGLVGFCMLIKRDIVEKIGTLDEVFSPGNFEDDDYSLRIIAAGYSLLLCHDTFIHHFGSVSFRERPEAYINLLETNSKKFRDKWGFSSKKTNILIGDMKGLIGKDVQNILEIGCGCGASLLRLKWQNPKANLYGIALSNDEAIIAKKFFSVSTKDISAIENLEINFEIEFFDVIILNDIINKIYDLNKFLMKIKNLLTPNGCLIINMPNVAHARIFRGLINDHWQYTEDMECIRCFTLSDIRKMISDTNCRIEAVTGMVGNLSKEDVQLIEILKQANFIKNTSNFEYESYLIKMSCIAEDTYQNIEKNKQQIKFLLRRIEYDINIEQSISLVIDNIRADVYKIDDILETINFKLSKKEKVTAILIRGLYLQGLIKESLQIAIKMYTLYPLIGDFAYLLAYLLDLVNDKQGALKVLKSFKGEKTDDIIELMNNILDK